MGLHVDWLDAPAVSLELLRTGDQFGEDTVTKQIGLVLHYDEAVVIEGNRKELLKLLDRARCAVADLDLTIPRTTPQAGAPT